MNVKTLLPALWLVVAGLCLPAAADEGHDHGAAPATPGGPALPRFTAVSEAFELVGVLDGTQVTVYLDRFADNSPVAGARLELELGGARVALQEHEPGEFEGTLAAALQPGRVAVTATVGAGSESDLLAGEFDLHDAHEAAHADESSVSRAWPYAAGAAAGLALLAWVTYFWRRRARSVGAGHVRAGGAA